MDKEYVRSILPKKPPAGLVEWAQKNCREELGPEYTIYHCERVKVYPELAELMEYQSMAPIRTIWGAVCDCTACGETFETVKVTGENAIRIVEGEDGVPYEMGADGNVANWGDGVWPMDIYEGQTMNCPRCLENTILIHKRQIEGGRTKQIMVVTLQNVEQYTTIIYWLVYRYVEESGLSMRGATPADAYVLDEARKLHHYNYIKHGGYYGRETSRGEWKLMPGCKDAIDRIYHDWGSINNRKKGAELWPVFPDMEGSTGEKTAIEEYLKAGWWPVEYLKLWHKHPCVENLCRQNCAKVVAGAIREAYRYSAKVETETAKYIDLSARKPYRMLGISKEAFKEIKMKGIQLSLQDMERWDKYRKASGKLGFAELMAATKDFKEEGINAVIQLMQKYKDADIDKLRRYMVKQNMKPSECGILLDARRMAKELAGIRELTPEEMWPRNLAAAHDRLDRQLNAIRRARKAGKKGCLDAKFTEIKQMLAPLEWTDGELCVLIPTCEEDLIHEGDVLRHCVGGYGEAHCLGRDTIFFIRHYRRPERPYYTLDIDMTERPKERQLHGYGNERHGLKKQYTHKIPQKVREFCNQWKEKVLLPWYAEQQAKREVKTA